MQNQTFNENIEITLQITHLNDVILKAYYASVVKQQYLPSFITKQKNFSPSNRVNVCLNITDEYENGVN